jgi:hypothetical protein
MEQYTATEPSEESKNIVALFADMRGKQLDFLDATGKSLIERIATFLTVLFAVTALSGSFPPAYLKHNTTAKVFIFITLLLFMFSLFSAIRAIRPFPYSYSRQSVTSMREALQEMTNHKSRWLRYANWLFIAGSLTLSCLIVAVMWGV